MTSIHRPCVIALCLSAAAMPATAQAPATDPTSIATAAAVTAQIEDMRRAMKPGQGFSWKPLVQAGGAVAALEYWTRPGKPAVHPDQAEYTIVVAGAGTLISGGHLVDASATKPDLTEGSRIEGGTTRTLHVGDVLMIPAGTPHWFGITGDRLVLLGTKIAQPAP